ncbi:hypothetical protein BJX99DRAFT_261661 [Aspergillus californicus]
MADGRAVRLRASCDACNEAKVRCNKVKPRCARCEKQSLPCMYGLSRRSHRDAPRIGALPDPAAAAVAAAEAEAAFCALPPSHSHNHSHSHTPSRTSGTTSPTTIPGFSRRDLVQPDGDPFASPGMPLLGLGSSPFRTDASRVLDMCIDQFHVQENGAMDLDTALQSIGDLFPMVMNDTPGQWQNLPSGDLTAEPLSSPGIDASGAWDPLASDPQHGNIGAAAEFTVLQDTSTAHACSCSSEVLKQLACMPLGASDEESIASFDIQLSQLRRAVKIAEACIGCSCIARDEMTILLISILIGRALQDFETTLSKLRLDTTQRASYNNGDNSLPASQQQQQHDIMVTNNTNTNTAPPKLSWGVLQIEPDEEEELKEHMWLLQFRKLGRVLNVFSSSLGLLRSAGSHSAGGSSTHATACRCIHMWLVQKAQLISSRYEREHDTPRPPSSMGAFYSSKEYRDRDRE